MKKVYCILTILFCLGSVFAANYVLVNSDEHNANGKKYYGTQLEGSTYWVGCEVTTDTTTLTQVYKRNKGITVSGYNTWWTVHDSTSTIYRNGFTYQSYNYPN